MTRLNLRLNPALAAIYLFFNAYGAVGAAAAETTQNRPKTAPPAPAAPLLWKVEGPRPSWLFGTAHTDDPKVATLSPAVTSALDASRSFHPELELNADLGLVLAAKMFQADTPALSSRLKLGLWQRVQKAGAGLGLPAEILDRLTPAFATLLFSAPPALDIAATIDGRLYARAQAHGLKVVALETVDQQFTVFEKLPESSAILALAETLDEVEAGRPNERKLLEAYARGDERAVLAIVEGEFNRSAASRSLAGPLLYDRNRAMADTLAPHLKNGGAFVAIGAAHLVGPRSVIELLRARGWKITRVTAP